MLLLTHSSQPRLKIILNIFSEHIRLEIHSVADDSVAQICMLIRVRNYSDFYNPPIPTRHRQTYAIHGNRAFRHDETREFWRHFHSQSPAFAASSLGT